MASTKNKLVLEHVPDYFLVGVSCHLKDYRFVWYLNQKLNCSFERIEDYEIVRKNGQTSNFLMYAWSEEADHYRYYVIGNRSESGLLVPEHKTVDYLFLIAGKYEHLDTGAYVDDIRSVQSVLTAYEINPKETKSCKNLIPE